MTRDVDVDGQRHIHDHDRTALVLYGSETGNSQDVAEELGRVVERLHFMTRVCEMDAIELNILLRFTIVIFVTSTTGQGEFPKNVQKFWKSLLRKRLPPDCLDHVHFTTFGLGDSSYAQFNYAARKLHKRLEQLGAKEVYPRGEADERHEEGIDGTFLSWSADFHKHLLSTFPLPEGVTPIPSDALLPPKILLELREDSKPVEGPEVLEATNLPTSEDLNLVAPSVAQVEDRPSLVSTEPLASSSATIQQDPKMLYEPPPVDEGKGPESPACPMLKEAYKEEPEAIDSKSPPVQMLFMPDGHEVKLIQNKRITPDTHWQDVRLLTFIIDTVFDYFVGDTITIFPKNFPDDVQAVIDMMGWHEVSDKEVRFNNNDHAPEYEDPMSINHDSQAFLRVENATLRDLLIHSLDITAIPKRHFFEMAAIYCDDEVHKLRLQEFASAEYRDEYYDYATRPRRSIIEVLHDFPSVKFPWQWALAVFPAIRGRQYSICSSGGMKQNPDGNFYNIEILVAMVKYKTVLKKVRQGLCSRYLDSLKPGTFICSKLSITNQRSAWVRHSEGPEWLSFPIICVAPGTGIAPCRALIWERSRMEWERRNNHIKMDRPVGKSYVFFGGRNKKADFFFEEEYRRPTLYTTVFTAFSRDQKEKKYVQDVLREQGQLITDLILNQEARIFVCGSSGNMPKSVRATFVDILEKWDRNKRGRAFAEGMVADLEKYRRYIQETW